MHAFLGCSFLRLESSCGIGGNAALEPDGAGARRGASGRLVDLHTLHRVREDRAASPAGSARFGLSTHMPVRCCCGYDVLVVSSCLVAMCKVSIVMRIGRCVRMNSQIMTKADPGLSAAHVTKHNVVSHHRIPGDDQLGTRSRSGSIGFGSMRAVLP